MKVTDQDGNEYDINVNWNLNRQDYNLDDTHPYLITIKNGLNHPTIRQWCFDNIGKEQEEWFCYFSDFPPEFAEFSNWYFRTKEDAIAFKLTFV